MPGIKIQIVEKVGTELVDIFHKLDPWQGQDCGREKCPLLRTKVQKEKLERQNCTHRNHVYETWCINCEETDTKRIVKEKDNDEARKEKN